MEHWQSFLALVNMIMFCTGIPGHYPVNETTSSLTLTFWYTLQVSGHRGAVGPDPVLQAGLGTLAHGDRVWPCCVCSPGTCDTSAPHPTLAAAAGHITQKCWSCGLLFSNPWKSEPAFKGLINITN